MTNHTLQRLLWTGVILTLGVTALDTRRIVPTVRTARPVIAPLIGFATGSGSAARRDSLDDFARHIADRDLFRLDRQPAAVAYGTVVAGVPGSATGRPSATATPHLIVSGIVGGPPWAALLDGIPGRDGSMLVRQGDTLAGFTVRAVRRTGVIITGMDTTWHLTLNTPWH